MNDLDACVECADTVSAMLVLHRESPFDLVIVTNRVRNHKNAHDLWLDICALHEGFKSEREERYHIAMRKLISFEMLAMRMQMICTHNLIFL